MFEQIEVTQHECRIKSGLRTADILLTKSNSQNSKFIRMATCAPVSHALVMVSPVLAVEADLGGVRQRVLAEVIKNNDKVMLLRHKMLTGQQGLLISNFLGKQVGKPYDKLGAVRSAAATSCTFSKYSALGLLVTFLDEASKLSEAAHDKTFYCSELVARAFDNAGAPLTRHMPKNVSPGAILRSEMLQIIQILK